MLFSRQVWLPGVRGRRQLACIPVAKDPSLPVYSIMASPIEPLYRAGCAGEERPPAMEVKAG